ncbi:TetR family transcriptional regulator [Burkholderia sp. AU6039]|nr:TetR family transcriptional regulator [Burkholderia sp. AU6039]
MEFVKLYCTYSLVSIPRRCTMSTSERRAGRSSSRDRLLDAAAELVASQGIQNLTIEAVAAAAKVTKAGLVYHFKTRDDLLAALIERVVGELDMLDLRAQEARDTREADDAAKPLKSSLAELSKLTFDMPEDRRLLLANLLAATSLYPHLAGPVRDFYSRSYARVAQSGPDAGQVLALVVALDGIALLEVFNLHRFTPEQRQVLRDTLESAIRKLP